MRYSILGFNQERVLSLFVIDSDGNTIKLDIADLLILNLMADFPNRANVEKMIDGKKVFFWASYKEILEELPILDIKKQALAKRFDKLERLNLVERRFVNVDAKHQDATFFCLTDTYESLLYERGGYRSQIREGIVVKYDTHNNNITTDNINKEIEDKSSTENGWRTDKSEYVKLIDEAVGELLMDEEYRKQQEDVYVNIDYKRTIIACGNYWKDDEQWESYKRKKINKPNFVSAIKKGFHINKIYNSRFQQQDTQAPAAEMTIKDKFENFLKWLHAKRGDRAMMSYRITMNDFCEMIKAYPSSATLCLIVLNITEQPIEPNEKLIDVFRRYRNAHP